VRNEAPAPQEARGRPTRARAVAATVGRISACRVCSSPSRTVIEAWIRKRVPYREVRARLLDLGENIYKSSLYAHRLHAGLELVEEYQLNRSA
jgi:hypothetical protein